MYWQVYTYMEIEVRFEFLIYVLLPIKPLWNLDWCMYKTLMKQIKGFGQIGDSSSDAPTTYHSGGPNYIGILRYSYWFSRSDGSIITLRVWTRLLNSNTTESIVQKKMLRAGDACGQRGDMDLISCPRTVTLMYRRVYKYRNKEIRTLYLDPNPTPKP